ncbi:glycoside hydrolase family 92 protein, partial [Nonlabens mediterrranea]|nr:glycoside hydrolase family 92 protein [Nonlabens mediterrranea]
MKRIALLIFTLIFTFSCKKETETTTTAQLDQPLTSYVNTFVGTGGHGHTYPGATMPFGMMQLSPDTRLDGWDGCSGYHYTDDVIYGFSHTHLSGTGVSDYGDILLMPTTKPILHNGADGKEGYSSKFSHDKEKASPGYYEVHLDDTDIDVRLTVTERAGMHEYRFRESDIH